MYNSTWERYHLTTLADRERPKNPILLSKVLDTVRDLEQRSIEPSFNHILNQLSTNRILVFHRTLRKYLDLLISSKLLTVKHENTSQPNIRRKQIYHTKSQRNQPIVEAGEIALLLHGLNWDIPSPFSRRIKTDMEGLALARVSGNTAYASLEDSIVQSLKNAFKAHSKQSAEVIVFATALLSTKRMDFSYLLRRAREERIEREILEILSQIDKTLASSHPQVEDLRTLFELRKSYVHVRGAITKSIKDIRTKPSNPGKEIVSSNEVIEYAGKQLGIRG